MVVEDETIVSLDLQSRLRTMGYEVVGAVGTGEEAISKAGEHRPDLVLMDVGLRGNIDGVQAAEQIKKSYQIPVIFLTASSDERTIQRAKLTEPFGYILKPFEDRELHSHIEIAVYKHGSEAQLRQREERFSLAAQGADDGLWDWNLEDKAIYFSPRWETLLGYSPGELQRDTNEWFGKVHPADRRRMKKSVVAFLRSEEQHFQLEYRIQHKNGDFRWMLTRGLGLRDSSGKVYRMAGSQTDITDRKLHDPMTGLPNRALFMDRLERALDRVTRDPEFSFAVLALKSDSFRDVTDSLGFDIGTELLSQFSDRLQDCVRRQDTVVNTGEGEFAILLEEIDSVSNATHYVHQIQDVLRRPFKIGDRELYPSVSFGVALSETGYAHSGDLLSDAQTAMHRAEESGNGQCEVFDAAMRSTVLKRLSLESQLRRAIEREEFILFYQPIVSIEDGSLVGFEALVRWQPEEGRIIPPGDFIPAAEETGLIVPLERWVLWKACTQMRNWQSLASNAQLELSVNFSARQYHQTDLAGILETALLETGLEPEKLKLEITEGTFLRDSEGLTRMRSKIRDLNIQLHLDDFGTGYSSLSYLHRFPISLIKIDRSFVSQLNSNQETLLIVKAIANLGQNLRMKVTAEGIERPDQLQQIRLINCDFGQGFLFSKPLNAQATEDLVVKGPSWITGLEKTQEVEGICYPGHHQDSKST